MVELWPNFFLQVYHSLKEKRGRVGSPRGVMGDVNRVPEDQDSRGTSGVSQGVKVAVYGVP